jgi:hypothetical protein
VVPGPYHENKVASFNKVKRGRVVMQLCAVFAACWRYTGFFEVLVLALIVSVIYVVATSQASVRVFREKSRHLQHLTSST